MKPKEFWLNLPVKDVKKSKEFFTKLGFSFSKKYGNSPNCAGLLVGQKKVVVMLFDQPSFKDFTNNKITNTNQVTEVLLSISARSKSEVDSWAKKVVALGGKSKHKPHKMTGWMYGCGFSDLDGHNWNVLHMDMSKMPK
jgi:predicted lactoylglutathione lyase